MPLAKYSGAWGLKQAAHLLRRATCGVTLPQINTFAGYGNVDTAVNNLLNITLPDPVLPLDPLTGQEWFSGTTPAASENDELLRYFKGWFIGQMMGHGINPSIAAAYSAREKMVLFLHTHFTAIESKISDSRALYFQNQLFRMFVRDSAVTTPDKNFKELTVKISIDNAMLKLLDGSENVKGSVNENYARELIELYSIGRGLEANGGSGSTTPGEYANYTEADVQAAAKVLSGWVVDEDFAAENIDPDTLLQRGTVRGSATNASGHDNDVKTFSAKFGNATIQPDPLLLNGDSPTLESALDEIRQLIDMIYAQEETARNICRKIYRFFVWAAHDNATSLQIENAVIAQMAATFTSNGFKIQPVIDELLRSQHFYDAGSGVGDDNFGGIIKSPLDLVMGTLRIFDIPLPDMITAPDEFYGATAEIVEAVLNLGMDFYNPYDVAGYEAYHQFPIYHRAWITPNSLANRYEFLRVLVTPNTGGLFSVNLNDFIRNNSALNAAAPNAEQLIIALAMHFFPMADNLKFANPNSTETLTIPRLIYFKNRFLQGLTTDPDGYWTQRWSENSSELPIWLTYLFNAMLQSPEYQLA